MGLLIWVLVGAFGPFVKLSMTCNRGTVGCPTVELKKITVYSQFFGKQSYTWEQLRRRSKEPICSEREGKSCKAFFPKPIWHVREVEVTVHVYETGLDPEYGLSTFFVTLYTPQNSGYTYAFTMDKVYDGETVTFKSRVPSSGPGLISRILRILPPY